MGKAAVSTRFWTGIFVGIIGVVVLAAAVSLTVIYSGAYNIAATEGHYSLVRWAFSTNFHNAVESGAQDVEAPDSFSQSAIAAGAAQYKNMCQHCHTGPGVERADWAAGMLPKPPQLTEAAADWKAEQIFWIVKNGVRMTGMPAFGPTHEDEFVWNIVAFVNELPAMTPQQYESLGKQSRTDSHHHKGEEHSEAASSGAAGKAGEFGSATQENRHRAGR